MARPSHLSGIRSIPVIDLKCGTVGCAGMVKYDGRRDGIVVRKSVLISEDIFRRYEMHQSIVSVSKLASGVNTRPRMLIHALIARCACTDNDTSMLIDRATFGRCSYIFEFSRGYAPLVRTYEVCRDMHEMLPDNKLCSFSTFRRS